MKPSKEAIKVVANILAESGKTVIFGITTLEKALQAAYDIDTPTIFIDAQESDLEN